MSPMLALLRNELTRQLLRPRWRVVFLFLLAVGFIWTDRLSYQLQRQGHPAFNILDIAVSLQSDLFAITWLFYLPFIWLTSDLIVRDFDEGAAALVVLRVRSFVPIWLSKVLALAALALVFSIGANVALLLGAALRGIPIAWSDSEAAQACLARGGAFPRPPGWSMAALVPLLSLYAAYALWAAALAPLWLTLLWRRSFAPLIAALAWILSSVALNPGMFVRSAWLSLLDIRYFLSYTKSFAAGVFLHTLSVSQFMFISGTLLTVLVFSGIFFARRIEF